MVQPTEPTSRKESPSALNHSSGTTFSSLVTKPPTKEVLKAEQVCLRIHSGSFPKQELTSRGTGLFKKAQHIVEQAITQRPRNLLAWLFSFILIFFICRELRGPAYLYRMCRARH